MARKSEDKEPDSETKPKAPSTVKAEPDAEALEQSVEPELSHPKPEPKKPDK